MLCWGNLSRGAEVEGIFGRVFVFGVRGESYTPEAERKVAEKSNRRALYARSGAEGC